MYYFSKFLYLKSSISLHLNTSLSHKAINIFQEFVKDLGSLPPQDSYLNFNIKKNSWPYYSPLDVGVGYPQPVIGQSAYPSHTGLMARPEDRLLLFATVEEF